MNSLILLLLSWSSICSCYLLMDLQQFHEPDLVCNDGSPAGYYLYTTGSSDWVIGLDGGFWCFDQYSCLWRAKNQQYLTSSTKWPNQRSMGGIFDTNVTKNPRFAGANKVLVGYCSSDMFTGYSNVTDGPLKV